MTAARITSTCIWVLLAVGGVAVQAQEPNKRDETLDVTMTLLPEHATGPEEITRRIPLPPAAVEKEPRGPREDGEGKDSRAEKKDPPGDAGEGRATAEEARERGREFGHDVAEQARENRENAGHGDPDGDGVPGNSNRPGNGPPEAPPGRP